MSQIPADSLIDLFERMYREHWSYKWGSSATGCVDCSGAFVWAYRQFGHSIYNGSNRIARVYTDALLPVSEACPGMAAFKIRKPNQKYYDLKAEYKSGGKYFNGDINDYYHIGLVGRDSKHVLNAQSAKTGFVRSNLSDNWIFVAPLKDVDYAKEHEMNEVYYMAKVTSINGKAVNFRKEPNLNGNLIKTVPVGTTVAVLEEVDNDWARIKVGGTTGYMMRSYLIYQKEGSDENASQIETITGILTNVRQLVDDAVSLLNKIK